MTVPPNSPVTSMQPLTVVQLRQDLPKGTIVKELDENTVLVEFVDEHGKTLEFVPVPKLLLTQVTRSSQSTLLDVTAVSPLPGFVLRLTFENGEIRRFSMSKLLTREATVFTPLRRAMLFRQVFIDNGTICWPGGADIDPELLYEQSVPECEASLVETLAAMPGVGEDEDFCCRRVGVAKGQFEMTDNEPASIFPIDADWENMQEVGLERWPDGEEEHNKK
jgi:hypothetical protein